MNVMTIKETANYHCRECGAALYLDDLWRRWASSDGNQRCHGAPELAADNTINGGYHFLAPIMDHQAPIPHLEDVGFNVLTRAPFSPGDGPRRPHRWAGDCQRNPH